MLRGYKRKGVSVAAELGLNPSTVRATAHRHRVRAPRQLPLTAREEQAIRELRADGLSIINIAKRVHRSHERVAEVLKAQERER